MTDLLLRRAREVAPEVNPSEITLFIVGHGTGLNQNSTKAIKDQAHKLKSSSRSIGSTTLADLCAELETRAASDDRDDRDDIGPLVSEVDALANTVIDAIQNDLGSPRAIASGE